MSNVKNYMEQGGERLVIRGVLAIEEDGSITIEGAAITRAAVQAESAATTVSGLKDDFNALLQKLKAAGLMNE